MDAVGWGSASFWELCHRTFLGRLYAGEAAGYKFSRWELFRYEAFSINCIAWLGEDFSLFGGVVGHEEEKWLTEIKPKEIGRMNCICGTALMVHSAFWKQRVGFHDSNRVGIGMAASDLFGVPRDGSEIARRKSLTRAPTPAPTPTPTPIPTQTLTLTLTPTPTLTPTLTLTPL